MTVREWKTWMAAKATLGLGQKLVTHSGTAFFRLGLIVEDTKGVRFGLTAKHILDRESDERIYDAVTNRQIGTRVSLAQSSTARRHFYGTIGAFVINGEEVALNLGDALAIGAEVASPVRSVGKTVHKVLPEGQRIPATNVGFGGRLLFAPPNQPRRVLLEIIEVRFPDDTNDAVRNGEAGSLLIDQEGAAFGLMIGGSKKVCYAAPLLPFLKENRLHAINQTSLTTETSRGDVYEGLSSDFRSALAGADKIRSELLAEGTLLVDPQSEKLPQQMIDMIEVD